MQGEGNRKLLSAKQSVQKCSVRFSLVSGDDQAPFSVFAVLSLRFRFFIIGYVLFLAGMEETWGVFCWMPEHWQMQPFHTQWDPWQGFDPNISAIKRHWTKSISNTNFIGFPASCTEDEFDAGLLTSQSYLCLCLEGMKHNNSECKSQAVTWRAWQSLQNGCCAAVTELSRAWYKNIIAERDKTCR